MFRFDFTVTLGDVLAIAAPVCLTIAGATWTVVRKMNDVVDMLRYFPPHRHVGTQIEYPPGVDPGRVAELEVFKELQQRTR